MTEDLSELHSEEGVKYFSLEDLVGNPIDEYCCTETTFEFDGLLISTWKWDKLSCEKSDIIAQPPLVAIHGGPGFCHNYMLPLIRLCNFGFSIIFYDQAGCGKSSYIADPLKIPPKLFTIKYYVDELQAVIEHHNLDSYSIYGQSWGTIVAQEFAISKPRNLLGLVLDGPLSDAQLYISTQWRDNLGEMPLRTQRVFKQLVENRDFLSPTYKAIEASLSAQFTSRLLPTAQVFLDSVAGFNKAIYTRIQGPSEFDITGSVLEHWSVTDRLHLVDVPALVIRGQYDSMTVECCQVIVDHIPKAWPLVSIPRAAHCKLLDEPEACCDITRRFLSTL